jgi:hypothetical protein
MAVERAFGVLTYSHCAINPAFEPLANLCGQCSMGALGASAAHRVVVESHRGGGRGAFPSNNTTMLLNDAITTFDRRNASGAIINRKTGEAQQVTPAARDAMVSSVRTALRRAVGPQDIDTVDLRPLLETLPEHARLHAEERHHERPANAADRVRRFIHVVEGRAFVRARGGLAYVLPDWRPLYQAIAALKKTRPERASAILRLQNVALLGGTIHDPRNLPDRATVMGWARAQQYNRTAIKRMLDAYRLARRLLAASQPTLQLPDLDAGGRSDLRGVLTIPDLPARLAAAGYTGSANPSAAEVVRLIAPKLGQAMDHYLTSAQGRNLSPESRKRVVGAVSRLVAELIRAGYEPASLTLLDLVDESIHGHGASAENVLLAEVLGPEATATTATTLLRHVLDRAAVASAARSPLKVLEAEAAPPQAPTAPSFYTRTVRRDAEILWNITQCVYGAMKGRARHRWEPVEAAFRDVLAHVKAHNKRVRLLNQKDKLRLLANVTLPQLVCIGLPALRRKALKLRAHYRRALRHHRGNATAAAVLRARKRYATWLRRYLVLAVMASDGLRVKNYAGARVGPDGHLRPTVRRDRRTGRWLALTRVETYWRGFDEPQVCLKVKTDENGGERTRYGRALRPGIVDHALLLDYWTDVRLDDLMSCGLLTSRAAYDPDADRFALFVSPRSRKADGRYTSTALSVICGRALHWVCIHALNRTGIPAWRDPARTTEWRSLLAGHVIRLLIATYWGGIRQAWERARILTDDTAETLVRSYSKVSARMEELKLVAGVENPTHFDAFMDQVEAGQVPTVP